MTGSEMPSMPQAAFAPLDYSAYGKTADSLARAGQSVDKSLTDFTAFEKAKDKEEMRVKAINEIVAKKPHLARVLRQDTTLDELGKGLSQLETGTIFYEQLKAEQARNPNLTLPDKSQFEMAIFKASPDAAKQLFDNWEKQIKASGESVDQAAAGQTLADEMKGMDPNATNEEIHRRLQERVPGAVAKAGANTIGFIAKAGQKTTDMQRFETQKARNRIAAQALHNASEKNKKDITFQEVSRGFQALVANGNFQQAREKLKSGAENLRADAAVYKNEKGNDDAYQAKINAADALMEAYNNGGENAEYMQSLAAVFGGEAMKKIAPSKEGDVSAAAAPAAPAPGKSKYKVISVTPSPNP